MQGPMNENEIIARVPVNAWKILLRYLAIPDLINLGKAIPLLTHFLDRARNWGAIYFEEFGTNPDADFTFFAKNWRRIYVMDTRGRVPEMDRGKLNHPVETLTECLIQGTDDDLYMTSNYRDTKTKSPAIHGGPGTCWSGKQLWIKDKHYAMHSVTVDFKFTCAAQREDLVYLYSPQLGIVEADILVATKNNSLSASQVRKLLVPPDRARQLCPTSSGLFYLGESGIIYKSSGVVRKGEYTKIIRLNHGIVALSKWGTLWNSLHDETTSYNEPMKDICSSLDILLAVGNSGHLYVLDTRQGLAIKDSIIIPGQVLSISPGFFTRYVCAIVSQNAANLGKRSLKTKLKSGYRAIKSDARFTRGAMSTMGAGFFL